MATYCRSNGKTPFYLNRSLTSIINQEYKNWDLIIVGDKYEPESELLDIINNFRGKTTNQIIYLKNEITERDFVTDKHNLWTCAGATSLNCGLNYARQNGYQYYCHIDDDDVWYHNHLNEIYKIYQKYPNCIFVNTRSKFINNILLPEHIKPIQINPNNFIPKSSCMVHSSISFRIDIILENYYTNLTNNGFYRASDSLMLDYIGNFIVKNGQYCSIYIPIVTCEHIEEKAS